MLLKYRLRLYTLSRQYLLNGARVDIRVTIKDPRKVPCIDPRYIRRPEAGSRSIRQMEQFSLASGNEPSRVQHVHRLTRAIERTAAQTKACGIENAHFVC